MTIPYLIDKQDNFEIVRDKIAEVLVTNIAAQMAFAVADGQDPNLWKVRIFLERSNPWEQYLTVPTDTSPLANIWYDSSTFPMARGNVVGRQVNDAVYNIDCYGYAESADDPSGGHTPGDREASFVLARSVRLIRNILMSSEYRYLDMRPTVGRRWIESVTAYQPEFEGQTVQNVVGARIAFRVEFDEFAPQPVPETLEYISTTVFRSETGEVYFVTDVDNTPTP